jgi:hypothetical protein
MAAGMPKQSNQPCNFKQQTLGIHFPEDMTPPDGWLLVGE